MRFCGARVSLISLALEITYGRTCKCSAALRADHVCQIVPKSDDKCGRHAENAINAPQ